MRSSTNKPQFLSMTILTFTFILSAVLSAAPGYKVISYKGKIKVISDNKVLKFKRHKTVHLKTGDAIMVYKDAFIEMTFPDRQRRVFKGPLYTTVEALKTYQNDKPGSPSGFKSPGLWKGIKWLFDVEGKNLKKILKGDPMQTLNFHGKILKQLDDNRVKDNPDTPCIGKDLNDGLEDVDQTFKAFSPFKRLIIRALVHKSFGLHKTALSMVSRYYEKIPRSKENENQRKVFKHYLGNWFLLFDVNIKQNNIAGKQFSKTFTSETPLWWSSFYFDGKELRTIKNTINYSLDPLKVFKVDKRLTNESARIRCFFIVASPDWDEIERFDFKETRQKLLQSPITETKSNTAWGYRKVVIKICL